MVVFFGVCVGFLAGFFGVGGGFISTPLLKMLFGIPYPIAIGSSLLQICGASFSAGVHHYRAGNVAHRLGGFLLFGSFAGVGIGTQLLKQVERLGSVRLLGRGVSGMDLFMTVAYVLIVLAVGTGMMLETSRARRSGQPQRQESTKAKDPRLALVLGCGIGILSGLFGIGGGFVIVPLLLYVFGMPTRSAVGTSVAIMLIASGFGAAIQAANGNIDYALVGTLMLGSLIGGQLGARVTRCCSGLQIRTGFAYFSIAAAGFIIISFIRCLI